jgi:hypothetical protein
MFAAAEHLQQDCRAGSLVAQVERLPFVFPDCRCLLAIYPAGRAQLRLF